jgi:hypothetical protein
MNTKQILTIGGGTAFGAIAAIGLMNIFSPSEPAAPGPDVGGGPQIAIPESLATVPETKDTSEGVVNAGLSLDEITRNVGEINPEELEGRRDEFRDSMRERQMERLTTKMAKWSAALGLEETQQRKLLDIASDQFDELEGLAATAEGENPDPATLSESAKRAMAIMSGRALEESMADVLTPAQQEKYEAFGNRQNQSQADVRTLRQIANLQENLMLTPEQRNDAYGIIYEDNLRQVEGSSDVSNMIDEFASQAGVTLDPSLQGMLSSLANQGLEELANGTELNEESVKNMAESALNNSVKQQLDQLRPVLTEAQLNLYQTQLEDRLKNISDMIPRE